MTQAPATIEKPRVVFVGSSQLGLRCLRQLLALDGIAVVGAVTNPRQFNISYSESPVTNVLHADVAPLCADASVPVVSMAGRMSDGALVEQIRAWRPALIVVAGWYHLVPAAIRTLAPCLGLHASLLPDYAGGAPLVWAMIEGQTETGISLFLLDEGVDAGVVLAQERTPIALHDTIATLYQRIEELAEKLVRDHVVRAARGNLDGTVQDAARRRVMPQRSPDDGRIVWQWEQKRLYDFVRAQTRPYPGAFAFLDGRKVLFWACEPFRGAAPIARSGGQILGVAEQTGRRGLLVASRAGEAPLLATDLEVVNAGDRIEALLAREGIVGKAFT